VIPHFSIVAWHIPPHDDAVGGLVVLLGMSMAGCESRPPEIDDDVTVFSDAQAATFTVEPTRILVPSGGNEWIAALPLGRILVSGLQAGFLRRLDAVDREPDRFVLHTTQAGLPDAVRNGRLQAKVDLSQLALTQSSETLRQGLGELDLTTGLSFDDLVLFENDKGKLLLKHAFVRLEPSATLDVSIEDEKLEYADISLSGAVTGTSGAGYVVCRANCQSAWVSAQATGGQYNALAICQALGYQRLGAYGTTGGAECGTMESGTSCNNIGQRSFNGMGALGGGIFGNDVHWECLPN